MLSYHANNITAGMGDMTSDDLMEYCEEMCGNGAWMTPGGCDDTEFQDLQDDAHCNRKSSHDFFLNVRIRPRAHDLDKVGSWPISYGAQGSACYIQYIIYNQQCTYRLGWFTGIKIFLGNNVGVWYQYKT